MELRFDRSAAERCHEIASAIAAGVNKELAAYSTETIERTVARLFGVDGVDPTASRCPMCWWTT
jgi:hypothetical protein